jgi:hypothetical protein
MNLLPHIAERVFATPLMIARAKLDVILGVLAPRLQGAALEPREATAPRSLFEVTADGIAIIPIFGTLVRRTTGLEAQSGLSSYASLSDQIAEAASDPSIRAILLDIDSPGGEAEGRSTLPTRSLKHERPSPSGPSPTKVLFRRLMRWLRPPSGFMSRARVGVGSIGVIAVHLDQSQADEQDGFKTRPSSRANIRTITRPTNPWPIPHASLCKKRWIAFTPCLSPVLHEAALCPPRPSAQPKRVCSSAQTAWPQDLR